MYIIFVSFILGFLFLSYNMVKTVVFNLLDNYNDNYKTGIIWFVTLMIFNIMIIIFVQYSNYHIKTYINIGTSGQGGSIGPKGIKGDDFIECIKEEK